MSLIDEYDRKDNKMDNHSEESNLVNLGDDIVPVMVEPGLTINDPDVNTSPIQNPEGSASLPAGVRTAVYVTGIVLTSLAIVVLDVLLIAGVLDKDQALVIFASITGVVAYASSGLGVVYNPMKNPTLVDRF